jgi:hypothetical protein
MALPQFFLYHWIFRVHYLPVRTRRQVGYSFFYFVVILTTDSCIMIERLSDLGIERFKNHKISKSPNLKIE